MWLGELEFNYHYVVREGIIHGIHLFVPTWWMALQILLGLPFIIANPIAYISRAFNLGRVFIHFWYSAFDFMVFADSWEPFSMQTY